MSSRTSVDTTSMEILPPTTSNGTTAQARSKKFPPPPLRLPAPAVTPDDEKTLDPKQQREQRKLSHNSCLSSSSGDCSHQPIPYILPTSQRSQILETLINSSSSLLVPPPYESKQRKSGTSSNANQLTLMRDRQTLSKTTMTESDWLDFMRLVLHKPLANELKLLLDKYKTAYFDRINAPNTSEETIRSSLHEMATEALNTYSVSTVSKEDPVRNEPSPSTVTNAVNNGNGKRKRKTTQNSGSSSSTSPTLNNQTRFVISQLFSSRSDPSKTINQQQQKQLQKKFNHLFRYAPNQDEYAYLLREGHLKTISGSASRSPTTHNLSLMLYDEVAAAMDDYDLEFSGISLDAAFRLPDAILAHISSSLS